jgi:ATP-dependent DNA helicase DinG
MLKHFPVGYKPTNKQKSILQKLEEPMKGDKKFIVLQAPTGSGKSLIAKTLCNTAKPLTEEFKKFVRAGKIYSEHVPATTGYRGSTVLTITKALQQQYLSIFKDTKVLKGKNSYDCVVDDNFKVDAAPCNFSPELKKDCLSKRCCNYYNALFDALSSDFNCLNYDMFLTLPPSVNKRQIMVCDEASEIEDVLVNKFTYKLPRRVLAQHFKISTKFYPNKDSMREHLIDVLSQITTQMNVLSTFIRNNTGVSQTHFKKFKAITLLEQGLRLLLETWHLSDYIIEHIEHDIIFTPLKVDNLSKHLFNNAERVVLMSATIVDHIHFTKSLGINQDEYEYIDIESDFPVENSPIYISSKMSLNFSNLNRMLPRVVKAVESVLDTHHDEKGIIHTHSQYINNYIADNINVKYKSRLLARALGVKNEALFNSHITSALPTVLMSPSMTHGVDLSDDLGRFQIIVKLPYLPIQNERIKRLKDISYRWYVNKMFINLIQSAGRTTRNKEDHSITYILDGNIVKLLQMNKDRLPVHFINRIQ